MECLRTPEDRFVGLPDFDIEPQYASVPDGEGGQLRMAFVEAGPRDGPPVLLLHGEPTWSFLYRRMLPLLAEAGLRAVAPDLVGFGRSDKPTRVEDYSTARHVEWIRALAFDALDLTAVTMVGQDWGALTGLRLAAEHPEQFARLVVANGLLPSGDTTMPEIWWAFRRTVEQASTLDVARIVQSGCVARLAEDVRAGYDAPFPGESYKAGVRAFPLLVPTAPDDPAGPANRAAWEVLTRSETPLLTAFSDSDPITAAWAPHFQQLPGAAGRDHPVVTGGGHFLQEDEGAQLAAYVIDFVRATAG